METKKFLTILVMVLCLLVCLPKVCDAEPMGTAFTYQGRLMDNNQPANGIYDLQCKLFDSSDPCAVQVGPTLFLENGEVLDGYFTVNLDFGIGIFDGDERWLEMGVRPGELEDPNTYTVIEPRQEITPTPYAIFAMDGPGSAGYWTASGNDIYNTNTGDVGIGTSTPNAKLHVTSSNSMAIYGCCEGQNNYSGYFGGGLGMAIFGLDEAGGRLIIAGPALSPATDAYGTIDFIKAFSGEVKASIISRAALIAEALQIFVDEELQMTIFKDIGVAIGATLPAGQVTLGEYQGGTVGSAVAGHEKQLVLGGEYNTRFNTGSSVKLLISDYDNDTGADIYPIYCEDEQNLVDFYVRKQEGFASSAYFGGQVGIGTKSPQAGLHLKGYGYPYSFMFLQSVSGQDAGFRLYEGDTAKWHIFNSVSGDGLRIYNSDGSQTVFFAEQSTGNVGIGTIEPSRKLTVRGNILLESVSTGAAVVELGEGLDYAEGFDTTEQDDITPGTILVIDAENPGKLAVSSSAYDSKVAGIVAGGKGLGSGVRLGVSQFDQDVALAGRVYCKVDATEAGVEPGDLLTTSSTLGYAMKATDYIRAQNAILGKAMEKLEQGKKGQILVLVTLQ